MPKSLSAVVRFGALMPRRAIEAVGRMMKGDQVLAHPDHVARAAYEARIAQSIEGAEAQAPAPDREKEAV